MGYALITIERMSFLFLRGFHGQTAGHNAIFLTTIKKKQQRQTSTGPCPHCQIYLLTGFTVSRGDSMFKKLALAAVFGLASISSHAENALASSSGTCVRGIAVTSGAAVVNGAPQCYNFFVDSAFVTQFAAQNGIRFVTRTKPLDIGVQENVGGSGVNIYYMVYYDAAARVSEVIVMNGNLQ